MKPINEILNGKWANRALSQNQRGGNFFKVPHKFEELYGDKLKPSEKYFYIILRKLSNRFKNQGGWFWHTDKKFLSKDRRNIFGFEVYGFSVSASKRTRKRLKELGLIETRYGWNKVGHRAGTYYRLIDETFEATQSSARTLSPEERDRYEP